MMENLYNIEHMNNIEQIQAEIVKNKMNQMKQMHFTQNKKDYYKNNQIKKHHKKQKKKLNGIIGLMKIEREKERNIITYFDL